MKLVFIAILSLGVSVISSAAFACAMGYGSQHNYDHDGTPDCASCTCAHNKPETPENDLFNAVQRLGDHGHQHSHGEHDHLHLAACSYQKYWIAQCKQSCWNDQIYQGGTWITVRKCQDIGCWGTRRVCN